MATETQDIVPVDETNDEIVTLEKKVEYSVKSEVISTVKTHETVTTVTEIRTENETIENHVEESIQDTSEEVKPIQNGEAEENKEEKKDDEVPEEEKPKENGESEPTAEETPAADVAAAAVDVEEPKVEANGEEVVEAAPAEETVQASPEEQIEEAPPKVTLHQLPRVKGIVSNSPQCLALETYFRMAKIPYDSLYEEKAQDVTKENKGKIPYIDYKKTKTEGFKNCIDFSKKEFEVELDKHLSAQDEAVAHAFRTMIEESTYWSLVYYRWVDNYGESKKMFSNSSPVLKLVAPKMYQNKCKKSIENHVIGRHSREELYNIAEQDLTALSSFLGEKTYFLGDQPTSFDAIAFGLLANFNYGAMNSPQKTLIQEKFANLDKFCEVMKETYWPDWADICGEDKFQDKPKTSLVKRLSFRSTNKKKKPTKEGEKSEPTSPSEEKADEQKTEGEAKQNGEAAENGDTAENGETKENGETAENGEAEEKKETEDKKEEDEVKKPDEEKEGEGETKSD